MGNSKSKIKRAGKTKRKSGKSAQFESISKSSDLSSIEFANDPQLVSLRQMIKRNPELFILNNLMMCVQFFRNYEEEIKHLKSKVEFSREKKMNEQLPPQKRVLFPDILQEHITYHVGFISRRQDFRPTIEPLQPVRIYMVHDNIDITESTENYSSHYSNVNDSITYSILLKPTKQGYVQLRILDDFFLKRKSTKEEDIDLSSILEDDDEVYSDGSIYGAKPRSNASVHSAISYKSKHDMLKSKHTRSLPNLVEDLSRSVGIKDYDATGGGSLEERRSESRSKAVGGSQQKDAQQSKFQSGLTSQDHHPSSNSSGYRSDNYAIYSESSCNPSSGVSQTSSSYEEIEESWITKGEFPKHCFKKVTYTSEGKIYNPAEENMQFLNSKHRRIKLAMKRHNYDLFYMSSTEFMRHFIKLFVYRFGELLCFDRETVEDVKREGCVLYCDKIMISDAFKYSQIEQYEIIPAIWLKWPVCGQEWPYRSRESWPSESDIDKVKDFGCYVVPEGYVPKSGNNNLIEDLEWQLTFPTAERYLETCMTQAQVQVYLIALMLHKTFMRPIFDTMFGMTTAHIRHKLFWMIEENDKPAKWPENGTGECLLKLLNSLYHNISQNEPILKDYFIKDRNLFQRIPCEHLLHTQKQLKRITENPIMYVFHAMENIQYKNNFFPRLDFEQLLRILTGETLALINPRLNRYISRKPQKNVNPDQEDKYDERGFWDTQRVKHSVQSITNRTLINTRKATDSIIEISTRCAQLEGPRLCILLKFFIKHFIEIAECCIQYKAYRQKTVYLNQADRLSILLFEDENYRSDAQTYREKIKSLRTTSSKQQYDPSNNPSDDSLRNSKKAIYVESLNNRFTSKLVQRNSTETKQKLSEERSDRENNHTYSVKAIIHERQYEEPDRLNEESNGVTINQNENQISKSEHF